MNGLLPQGSITTRHAREITVGTWLVPNGRVTDIYQAPASQVRQFKCVHPHKRPSLRRTESDHEIVLIRDVPAVVPEFTEPRLVAV